MIVIADTTPLNYLALIDRVKILPQLYGRVLIPPTVWEEFQRPETPEAACPPLWLGLLPSALKEVSGKLRQQIECRGKIPRLLPEHDFITTSEDFHFLGIELKFARNSHRLRISTIKTFVVAMISVQKTHICAVQACSRAWHRRTDRQRENWSVEGALSPDEGEPRNHFTIGTRAMED